MKNTNSIDFYWFTIWVTVLMVVAKCLNIAVYKYKNQTVEHEKSLNLSVLLCLASDAWLSVEKLKIS
jgi:hypothetical protein